jgi:hypothetical protein
MSNIFNDRSRVLLPMPYGSTFDDKLVSFIPSELLCIGHVHRALSEFFSDAMRKDPLKLPGDESRRSRCSSHRYAFLADVGDDLVSMKPCQVVEDHRVEHQLVSSRL